MVSYTEALLKFEKFDLDERIRMIVIVSKSERWNRYGYFEIIPRSGVGKRCPNEEGEI